MVVTCDAPTPHFSSGCELLLAYDKDYDGLINLDELNQSYTDYENGIITEEEFDFVSDAYINDGINVVCSMCFTFACDQPTPHFSSACALLLHYDKNKDGVIGDDEVLDATSDFQNGLITLEEREFVIKAWLQGSIVDLCPTCISKTVTFESVPADADVKID